MPEFTHASPEDRFADALDAITLGLERRDNDAPLAAAARSIGAVGLDRDGFHDTGPVTLDRAAKRRIWADLMREHGAGATPEPAPTAPGTAGSTLSPNPWVAPEPAPAKRARPSTGVLRFVPAAQPASTFLLVIAALVLVGGAFASLAPNGNGVFTNASATENPAQLAFASPEASPATGSCDYEPLTIDDIERIRDTGSTQPERSYVPASIADAETTASTRGLLERINACEGDDPALWWSMMTNRAVLESPLGVSSASLVNSRDVSERYGEALLGEMPSTAELDRYQEQRQSSRSDFMGDSEIVHLMGPEMGVVRALPDGRLAIYSAEIWLRRDGRFSSPYQTPDREIFAYTIFGNPEFGGGLDEPLMICLGACDGFWLDIANDTYVLPGEPRPAATPETTFDYLQQISPEDCTVDSRPLEEIRALQGNPGDLVEREYVPVVLADDGPSAEIPRAARAWRACSAYGMPSQRMALESPRFIFESSGNAVWDAETVETQTAAIDQLASEVVNDWTDYFIEAPVLGEADDASTEGYIPPDGRAFLIDVYQLQDGRFGGPVITLVPPGYIESMTDISGLTVEFQIYVEDPTQGGHWVLDETVWLCVSGCDAPTTSLASPEASPATPIASPMASPVAVRR